MLALTGELGSGKTTFVQGLAKGLEIKGRVISPTFIIVRKYQIPNNKSQINSKSKTRKILNFYHVDFYRLEGELGKEVENLGLTEVWSDPNNIVVIEWAEKIKDYLPEGTKWVRFEYSGEDERRIVSD